MAGKVWIGRGRVLARIGTMRPAKARTGMAGKEWQGGDRSGLERRGPARNGAAGAEALEKAFRSVRGFARCRCFQSERRGKARWYPGKSRGRWRWGRGS
jgi:hypothetical protein